MPKTKPIFDKKSIKFFSFDGYKYNEKSGVVSFFYSFDDTIHFVEKLTFLGEKTPLSADKRTVLSRVLEHLHIIIGISYYKAALPQKILIRGFELSQKSRDFWTKIYTKGLQEFAYVNKISLADKVNFPPAKITKNLASNLKLPQIPAILMGGGKDSFLAYDMCKNSSPKPLLLHIGNHQAMRNFADDNRVIRVKRQLSDQLKILNQQGAYNGHIPISAIYAFIALAAGVIYDFDTAIISNERSANIGSKMSDGEVVNHQYSKSYEFEADFMQLVKNEILSSFRYFSILRPFSELSIAKMFAKIVNNYANFISCNQVFKQDCKTQKWCLNCQKCRFVFLSLAAFLDKKTMLQIFKINLLDDPEKLPEYLSLLGFGAPKPFDCVGEIEESLAAFYLLFKNPEWTDDAIVLGVKNQILTAQKDQNKLLKTVLTPDFENHNIPSSFLTIIQNYNEL